MGRLTALSRRAFVGLAVIGGGGAAHLADDAMVRHATPDSFRSTMLGAPGRGSVEVTWSAPAPAGNRIALCFDDGPTELFTPLVLDLLARAGVRATFFCIGALVDRHPDLVRRAVDEGHEIQNHSYDHNSAAVLGAVEVGEGMARGADAVHRVTGTRSTWYRPPLGEVTTATLRAAHETGHRLALWSLGRDDHGESHDGDASAVRAHLLRSVRPGDVIDLHDGIGRSSFSGLPDGQLLERRRAEASVLPEVLAGWREAGVELVTLSQLAGDD